MDPFLNVNRPPIIPTAFVEKTVCQPSSGLALPDHTAEGFLRSCSVPSTDMSVFQGHLLWLLLGSSKFEHQQVRVLYLCSFTELATCVWSLESLLPPPHAK